MEKMDYKKTNELVKSGDKLVKILYFVILIIGLYAITLILEKWHIINILFKLLKILSPLFIGIMIAWLLEPIVTWLSKKKIKRVFGALVAYILFIGLLTLFFIVFIPTLISQIDDFLKLLPSIIDYIKNFIDDLFINMGINNNVKLDIFDRISDFGISLTKDIPEFGVNIIKSSITGITIFVMGILIGFYLLISFDNITDVIVDLIPSKKVRGVTELMYQINIALRHYVDGIFLVILFVFVFSSIGFMLSGLNAPLLFGLICGVMDLIPFIGPILGGFLAVIVGFSIEPIVGILALITVIIVQCVENAILQPLIMSKQVKLHPVLIFISLLIFGSLFGIIGMIFATPIIATLKVMFIFFEKKYNILKLYN